jgi:hypothetical protein
MSRHVSDETFRHAGETIFQPCEALWKRASSISGLGQQRGSVMFAYILNSIYREVSQELPVGHGKLGGKVMTEVVTAVLVFLSVGVFLAHAFDAYRTGAVGTRNPRY